VRILLLTPASEPTTNPTNPTNPPLAAEAAWNTRDPEQVAGAYTIDAVSRNRSELAIAVERGIFGPRPDGDRSRIPLR